MLARIIILLFSFGIASQCMAQKAIKDIGHYTQIGLPIAALGVSVIKGDKEGVIQLGKSVIVETALVYALKNVIDRKRPNGGGLAFPSGHTAISFTSSTYLYKRYGWEYGLPATALAAFVGYSRFGIDEPVHHFTDVVAGAILGSAIPYFLVDRHIKNENFSIQTSFGTSNLLVGIQLKF